MQQDMPYNFHMRQALAMVVPKVYNLLNDYDKLMEHCRKLESKLNLLQSDCDNKKKDEDSLKEKLELF